MRPSALLAFLTILTAAAPGFAQNQPAVRLDAFRMAETPEDGLAVSRPDDLGHLRFSAQAALDYSLNPLVYRLRGSNGASEAAPVVEHLLALQVGAALGLFDRLVVYGGLPVNLVLDGELVPGVPRADGTSLGDASLGARVRLFGERDDVFALGLGATVTFPTARAARFNSRFAGDEFLTLQPEILAELRPLSVLRVTMNLGVLARQRQFFDDGVLDIGSELTFGLGVTWSAVPQLLDVYAELYGAAGFRDFGDRATTPVEAVVGAGLTPFESTPARGLRLKLGVGTGVVGGYGAGDLRVIFLAGYALPQAEPPPPPPPPDEDGDGILDDADACPSDAEDVDGHQDEDGCPEADNDADGVLDFDDLCPSRPEDPDGYADDDGCPETDADGDGVPDVEDQCPVEAGVESCDGCPAASCGQGGGASATEEPVVADPFEERVEEPPPPPPTVRSGDAPRPGELLDERVYFDVGRYSIRADQRATLERVVRLMIEHPELRLLVEGHADQNGEEVLNINLSAGRALQVIGWIRRRGIRRRRLVGGGCGERHPATTAVGGEQLQENRRVELYVLGPGASAGHPGCAREDDR